MEGVYYTTVIKIPSFIDFFLLIGRTVYVAVWYVNGIFLKSDEFVQSF